MSIKQFLVDANIIIGAKKGDKYCIQVLTLAEEGKIKLVTTREISEEVRMPNHVRVITIPKTKRTAYNYDGFLRYLQKNYGRGGKREEPSNADKSLVQAFTNGNYSGIISDDSDIGYIVYSQLPPTLTDIIFMSREFVQRRVWEL